MREDAFLDCIVKTMKGVETVTISTHKFQPKHDSPFWFSCAFNGANSFTRIIAILGGSWVRGPCVISISFNYGLWRGLSPHLKFPTNTTTTPYEAAQDIHLCPTARYGHLKNAHTCDGLINWSGWLIERLCANCRAHHDEFLRDTIACSSNCAKWRFPHKCIKYGIAWYAISAQLCMDCSRHSGAAIPLRMLVLRC